MNFGPHTVQIFVSLIVVLAAAGVALVCDLLKGNNEHLRELAVELKVRNEEAERRIQSIEKKSKRIPDLAGVRPVMAAVSAPAAGSVAMPMAKPEAPEPVRVPMPSVAAMAGGVAPGSSRPSRAERRPRREMSPAVAAVAQAAAAIANHDRPAEAASISVKEAANEFATAGGSSGNILSNFDNSRMGRKNWESILKRTGQPRQPGAVIPFESIREAVPAGYHEASVLQRAVESGKAVSGLVVSIGTNALNPARSGGVVEFIQSLLGPQDFGCQSGNDEYVLVCGGDQGAAAQRRLSAIAEKLWDFQLRSIGDLSLQFSWGSFEARGERIGEAVATAIEQMQETRQSRRVNVAQAV